MKLLFAVLVCSTAVAGQLSAIPACAQECFSSSVDYAGCVIDGLLDPTCACTSYLFKNTLGGHDTAMGYVRNTCIQYGEYCMGDDLEQFSEALNNICYNEDFSPRWNCGVIPGDPVPVTPSITPTGYNTVTFTADPTTTWIGTLPAYPMYTTIMTSSWVYTTKVVTEVYVKKTSIYTTRSPLYEAVCPTRVIPGRQSQQAIPTDFFSGEEESTSTENLWAEITAAAASASLASVSASLSSSTLKTEGTSLSSTVQSTPSTSNGGEGSATGNAVPAQTSNVGVAGLASMKGCEFWGPGVVVLLGVIF